MTEQNIVPVFDRRIAQIERGLVDITSQMQDQAKTLSRISEALTAVVRLEERLTASIENSRDQKAALERVHGRLDKQVADTDAHLLAVYQRIEAERKECAARFGPVNDALQQQHGALKFASLIFPLLATAALTLLGSVIASQQSELRELVKSASRHESYDAQLQSLRRETETKK